MFCDELRRAIMASPRTALADVAKALWTAVAGGQVSETDAEALSDLIETRRAVPVRPEPARVGSRPRTDATLERRRRWAAAGLLPPTIAAHFTMGETAALAVIALEVGRAGSCRWPLAKIAAVAGISVSTVKRAVREAKALGLLDVQERRVTWWRNDPNVITIASPAWAAWLAKGGGGVQSRTCTGIQRSDRAGETAGRSKKGYRGSDRGGPTRSDAPTPARIDPWRRSVVPAAR